MKKKLMLVLAFIAALLALFGGYYAGQEANLWGEPDELKLMRQESVASPSLLDLNLSDRTEWGHGSLTKKATSPQIRNTFDISSKNAEKTQNEIVRYARKDGWKERSITDNKTEWIGRKQVERFVFSLRVFTYENKAVIWVSLAD